MTKKINNPSKSAMKGSAKKDRERSMTGGEKITDPESSLVLNTATEAAFSDEEEMKPVKGQSADVFDNPTAEFVIEPDFQFDDLTVTPHADDWSEGICDEANLDFDSIEREMTEIEPLHVVAEGYEIVELQPSDSVCAPLHDEDQLIAGDEGVHTCLNEGCNCNVVEGDFCTTFCQTVDPAETEHECGCGHTACEVTKELGNELFEIAS